MTARNLIHKILRANGNQDAELIIQDASGNTFKVTDATISDKPNDCLILKTNTVSSYNKQ